MQNEQQNKDLESVLEIIDAPLLIPFVLIRNIVNYLCACRLQLLSCTVSYAGVTSKINNALWRWVVTLYIYWTMVPKYLYVDSALCTNICKYNMYLVMCIYLPVLNLSVIQKYERCLKVLFNLPIRSYFSHIKVINANVA